MVITFASPILLGVPVMALFRIKKLTKKELISSFVPIIIIALVVLSWGI